MLLRYTRTLTARWSALGRSSSRCKIVLHICHYNYFAEATLELLALASVKEQDLLTISPMPTP